jgi:hypothetical protein
MGELNTAEEKINRGSGAAGQYKESQGPGLPPLWKTPTVGAKINTGSYTGNNTANRAIAHGLGVAAKLVIIVSGADGRAYIEVATANRIYDTQDNSFYQVTNMNATNFYVGNAAHYDESANANTKTYKWVAIG